MDCLKDLINAITQNKESEKFTNFKEFLQLVHMNDKQRTFLIQMFKECELHDLELLFSFDIDKDVPVDSKKILWCPSNNYNDANDCINFKVNDRHFQIKPTEDSSSGLFLKFIIQALIEGVYECDYCHKKTQDKGSFIEICHNCLQSCCYKCRMKIVHCRNCKKENMYSIKFQEI